MPAVSKLPVVEFQPVDAVPISVAIFSDTDPVTAAAAFNVVKAAPISTRVS